MKKFYILISAALLASACQKESIPAASPATATQTTQTATQTTQTSTTPAQTAPAPTNSSPPSSTGATGVQVFSGNPPTLTLPSKNPTALEGSYAGVVTVNATPTTPYAIFPFQFQLRGNQYQSDGSTGSLIVGFGDFAIGNNNITFGDIALGASEYAAVINPDGSISYKETAFDMSNQNYYCFVVALRGKYDYSVKGDSLLMSHTANGFTYTYKVKKQ